MTRGGKGVKRKFHLKDRTPSDPEVHRLCEWPSENLGVYYDFRRWLSDIGYSQSSICLYGVAARQAIGYLNKPYWVIDIDSDIEKVWRHFQARSISPLTLADYHKSLIKLAEYLQLRLNKPRKPKTLHWEYYLDSLPDWLGKDLRSLLLLRQRSWKPEKRYRRSFVVLSDTTRPLRWIHSRFPINSPLDITPERWFDYLDSRLDQGISPKTVNDELQALQYLLHFIEERGTPVCQRMYLVDTLAESRNLPRDLPPDDLVRLQQAILDEMQPSLPNWKKRTARMDLAWFLLMLHSGLRT
jgi:site-specific recombinase XerC